jgi:6-phosphofructokinase 2
MNPAIDVSIEVKQLVAEKKLRCESPHYEAGGGGINVAKVIFELGGKAVAVYAAGGSTGQMLRNLLDAKGIDQQCISIEGRTREDIAVLESTSGQLYRLVMPGPTLSSEEQNRCLGILKDLSSFPEYMVISGSLPAGVTPDFYQQVVREMKKQGTEIILDTEAQTLKEVVQEGVFLIKPNMNELRELAEKDLKQEKEQEQTAHDLISGGRAEIIVVSLGAAGVLFVSEDISERIRAPSVSIRSRVGAGDSMVAGITLALSQGRSITEAVNYGIAAGSAAVMTPGTQLCRREDVERLFSQLS